MPGDVEVQAHGNRAVHRVIAAVKLIPELVVAIDGLQRREAFQRNRELQPVAGTAALPVHAIRPIGLQPVAVVEFQPVRDFDMRIDLGLQPVRVGELPGLRPVRKPGVVQSQVQIRQNLPGEPWAEERLEELGEIVPVAHFAVGRGIEVGGLMDTPVEAMPVLEFFGGTSRVRLVESDEYAQEQCCGPRGAASGG